MGEVEVLTSRDARGLVGEGEGDWVVVVDIDAV